MFIPCPVFRSPQFGLRKCIVTSDSGDQQKATKLGSVSRFFWISYLTGALRYTISACQPSLQSLKYVRRSFVFAKCYAPFSYLCRTWSIKLCDHPTSTHMGDDQSWCSTFLFSNQFIGSSDLEHCPMFGPLRHIFDSISKITNIPVSPSLFKVLNCGNGSNSKPWAGAEASADLSSCKASREQVRTLSPTSVSGTFRQHWETPWVFSLCSPVTF